VESKPAFVTLSCERLPAFVLAALRRCTRTAFEAMTVPPPFHQTFLWKRKLCQRNACFASKFVSFLFRETTFSGVSFVSIAAGVAGLSSAKTPKGSFR